MALDYSTSGELGPLGNRPETVGAVHGRRFEDKFGGDRDRRLQTSINRILVYE